jgi:hypothetical protein
MHRNPRQPALLTMTIDPPLVFGGGTARGRARLFPDRKAPLPKALPGSRRGGMAPPEDPPDTPPASFAEKVR